MVTKETFTKKEKFKEIIKSIIFAVIIYYPIYLMMQTSMSHSVYNIIDVVTIWPLGWLSIIVGIMMIYREFFVKYSNFIKEEIYKVVFIIGFVILFVNI